MNVVSRAFKRFIFRYPPKTGTIEFLKFVGPGLIVTVGFIDPGNWAANIAAGSQFGYKPLWTIRLSTVMLIVLQHIAAHLSIATGLCLAEVFSLIFLTSSRKVMGRFANRAWDKVTLVAIAGIVSLLNIMLFLQFLGA